MPTGYTYKLLENPEMTFREFVELCSRAFGATFAMRDSGLDAEVPEAFAADPWHLEKLREAEAKARDLEVMTRDEAAALAAEEYREAIESHRVGVAKQRRENDVFDRMLAEARGWQPPTPEHEGMKTFMLEQLESSKSTYEMSEPKLLTAEEYLHRRREWVARDLTYHAKGWKEEVERTEKRNLWLRQLRAALPNCPVHEQEKKT